jgi:hypothetical protein
MTEQRRLAAILGPRRRDRPQRPQELAASEVGGKWSIVSIGRKREQHDDAPSSYRG